MGASSISCCGNQDPERVDTTGQINLIDHRSKHAKNLSNRSIKLSNVKELASDEEDDSKLNKVATDTRGAFGNQKHVQFASPKSSTEQ